MTTGDGVVADKTEVEMPERFDLTSASPVAARLSELKALFPEAVQENKLDLEALERTIGEWVEPGPERFGLTWPGKARCLRIIQQPSVGTLRPMPHASVDFDRTKNVIIEGDNLEVLKLLQKSYYGKVKMIYLDPPYNTGDDFIYPDNFREGLQGYLRYSGQVDAEGLRVSANAETDGRFHSKWLTMMYPRLYLARNLLTNDGLLFITIDDGEHANLRLLLNEVFGENNFVANIVWQKAYVANMTAKHISTTHDNILVYARDADAIVLGKEERGEDLLAKFTNPNDDPRGPWKAENLSAGKFYAAGQYEIVTPAGKSVLPPPGRYWRCNREQYERWLTDGRITFGRDGQGRPMLKKFLGEIGDGLTPSTWWRHEQAGSNKEASLELKALFPGEVPFDTPKPTKLIRRMLDLLNDRDALVLDFFAGSGTTGHAVLDANEQDGGSRRFILVQLPEPTQDPALPTIAAVTRERVRRAAARLDGGGGDLLSGTRDRGFRAYELTSSNFAVWDGEGSDAEGVQARLALAASNVGSGRSQDDLITELLMKAGYPLTADVVQLTLAGKRVYAIEDNALLVCLEPALTIGLFEEMADLKPSLVLVLDAGFGDDDELKVNALQTIRSRNTDSEATIELKVV